MVSGTFYVDTLPNPRFLPNTGSVVGGTNVTFNLGTGSAFLNNRNGNLTVQIGFGVRAASAGRAFFRSPMLNHIAGSPPPGGRQLDIASDFSALVRPELDRVLPRTDRKDRSTDFLARVADLAVLPKAERQALLGVSDAKPPTNATLFSDFLRLRTLVALFFVLPRWSAALLVGAELFALNAGFNALVDGRYYRPRLPIIDALRSATSVDAPPIPGSSVP